MKRASRRGVRARHVTRRTTAPDEITGARWTFLTNHAHVLLLLAWHPTIVLREVAHRVGITERAVQRIIADLEAGGFIEREKMGRQNRYRIRDTQSLRHSLEAHRTIGDLVEMIGQPSEAP